MSTKAVIGALAAAILLGVVTLLVLRSGSGGAGSTPGGGDASGGGAGVVAPGERVLGVEASAITAMRVTSPGGRVASVERDDSAGGWVLRTPGSAPWRVDEARVGAVLRVLSEARAVAPAPADGAIPSEPEPVLVALGLEGGAERVLVFSGRPMAGQVLTEVRAEGLGGPGGGARRLALVEDALLRVFTSPGAGAWRSTGVLARPVAGVSRVRLEWGADGVSLSKADGRWGVTDPAPAPASAESVQRVLGVLDAMRVTRFYDGRPEESVPDEGAAGLAPPAARLVVEFDRREPAEGGSVRVTTERQVIELGSSADAAGGTVFARSRIEGGPLAGTSPLLAVHAGTLAQLRADVSAYVSATATAVVPADVGAVMVIPAEPAAGPTGYRRVVDPVPGWVELRADGSEATLSADEGAEVDQLLAFLHGTPAAGVRLTGGDEGVTVLGRVELLSAGGAALDKLELVRTPETAGMLALARDRVLRVYAPGAAPARLGWGVPAAPQGTDITK